MQEASRPNVESTGRKAASRVFGGQSVAATTKESLTETIVVSLQLVHEKCLVVVVVITAGPGASYSSSPNILSFSCILFASCLRNAALQGQRFIQRSALQCRRLVGHC